MDKKKCTNFSIIIEMLDATSWEHWDKVKECLTEFDYWDVYMVFQEYWTRRAIGEKYLYDDDWDSIISTLDVISSAWTTEEVPDNTVKD